MLERARQGRIRCVVIGQIALLTLVGSVPAAGAQTVTPTTAGPSNVVAQPPPQPGGGLGTSGVREWILSNLIPLLLLAVALLLLWLGGGKGDNAGIMKRLGGVLVALAIVGLAVTTDAAETSACGWPACSPDDHRHGGQQRRCDVSGGRGVAGSAEGHLPVAGPLRVLGHRPGRHAAGARRVAAVVPFGFFTFAWSLVIGVGITRLVGKKITHERPLRDVARLVVRELTTPRQHTTPTGGAASLAAVRIRDHRPRRAAPRRRKAGNG